MSFSRTQDAISLQLQEDRLSKLCDDNAFVNVVEVLRRQRRDGPQSSGTDLEADFLEPSAAPSSAPPRLHLSRLLLEQHRAYLKELEGDQHEERKRENDGASTDGSSSSASSSASASAASLDSDVMYSSSDRVKYPRGGDRHRGKGKKRLRKESNNNNNNSGKNRNIMNNSNSWSFNDGDTGRECRKLRTWCVSRRIIPAESSTSAPSYIAMAAPPSLHSGGYHLCSVCLLPANYKCVRCRRALFCSIDCHVMHDATRCMKFIV